MPTYKITTLFSHTTALSRPNSLAHRTGGWSESWYQNANSLQDVLNLWGANPGAAAGITIWWARSNLLCNGAAIVGARIQPVLPPGPSQIIALNLPGTNQNLADVPQMAILARAPALGFNNVRRFTLRGVPDGMVTEGEANFDPNYLGFLSVFQRALASLVFRARDLSQVSQKITTVDVGTATVVNTEQTLVGINVNDFVRISRTLDTGRNLRGGRFQVTVVGPGNALTIKGWTFGPTVGGSVRKDAVVYVPVDSVNTTFPRVVVRKVGRPFTGYRGRRSKRR